MPITSHREGTDGIARNWVLSKKYARKIVGRYMVGCGAVWVSIERLIPFKVEVG